jgi:hypothetical protein
VTDAVRLVVGAARRHTRLAPLNLRRKPTLRWAGAR